jgi:hypothetical protein
MYTLKLVDQFCSFEFAAHSNSLSLRLMLFSCWQSTTIGDSPPTKAAHMDVGDDAQSSIGAGEDVEESTEVDEEDELLANQIRVSRKVNSIATIEALRLKPSSLSRMMVPLCRMVAMPIVRSTLSSDLASLEADFVHGYREGAAVFYLSTTNEGGMVDKVTNEDL